MREPDILRRIAAAVSLRPGVSVGIGDDAAVLEGDPPLLAATDMLVEDVHFRRRTSPLADVGHKALAVNLSDLAAMGARPVAALVALGVPAEVSAAEVGEIYAGMEALAAVHALTLAGGDVTRAPVLTLGVTVLGRMPEGVPPVRRSGGRPGDVLAVTGPLGASAAGLMVLEDPLLATGAGAGALREAHRRPRPLLDTGEALARAGVHAMMDVSDGLAHDADRLARASGLRAVIALERVPVAPGVARVAAAAGRDPAELAATGGEDFALLVAGSPALVDGSGLIRVGALERGAPGVVLTRGGSPVALPRLGWEH